MMNAMKKIKSIWRDFVCVLAIMISLVSALLTQSHMSFHNYSLNSIRILIPSSCPASDTKYYSVIMSFVQHIILFNHHALLCFFPKQVRQIILSYVRHIILFRHRALGPTHYIIPSSCPKSDTLYYSVNVP